MKSRCQTIFPMSGKCYPQTKSARFVDGNKTIRIFNRLAILLTPTKCFANAMCMSMWMAWFLVLEGPAPLATMNMMTMQNLSRRLRQL